MIVSPGYYYGLPDSQMDTMEAIAQATVDELFNLARTLWERLGGKGKRDFGDLDFTIQVDTVMEPSISRGVAFKRLRLADHSAGWWAVLQWGSRYPDESDPIEFWFHAKGGKLPRKMDWKAFRDDWGYSRCRLHMQATKTDGDPWYCPVHTLDFKHPLLTQFHNAVTELDEES